MRQTIMLMAACAALLASCTNEEMNEGLGIDTPIQVTASVEGIMTTRADNTTESLTELGLSIKDGQSYDGDYAGENIKVSKPEDASAWTLADEVLYKGSGQTYFAYAPYDADMTGETLTFTVDADQAKNDLQGSDLLHASGKVESANLSVTFSHKLSKLTVTLTPEGFGPDEVKFTGVTLQGTLPTTTLALVDGESVEAGALGEASGTATDIKMWHNEGVEDVPTYECILVPQEATYSVLINATVGSEQKTYVYTPSAAYKFESDQRYTLALKVKKTEEPTAIESIDVKGWGDGNAIALGNGEADELDYTIDAEGHYTVRTAEGLQEWATAVVSDNDINCTLAANIDMTGQTWQRANIIYSGTFDGNGHTITGLTDCLLEINNGTVRNLTFIEPNVNVTSSFNAGAVTGENGGTIENCHVVGGSIASGNGFIPPIISVGGIAGVNNNKIRACSSSAAVTAIEGDEIGGIVGDNKGSVLACYATGSVTGNGADIGAIAGRNSNTTTTCYWWSGNTAQGVGEGTDNTTKVEGDVDWETARTTMNEALLTDGISYRWVANGGPDAATRPLVIAIM